MKERVFGSGVSNRQKNELLWGVPTKSSKVAPMSFHVIEPLFQGPTLIHPLVLKAVKGIEPAEKQAADGAAKQGDKRDGEGLQEVDHQQQELINNVGDLLHEAKRKKRKS